MLFKIFGLVQVHFDEHNMWGYLLSTLAPMSVVSDQLCWRLHYASPFLLSNNSYKNWWFCWDGTCGGTGRITGYLPSGGPFVRMDSHIYSDYVVPPSYDSLLGKVCCWHHSVPSQKLQWAVILLLLLTLAILVKILTKLVYIQLIVWAPTREKAIVRMQRALNDTIITGKANDPLQFAILMDD